MASHPVVRFSLRSVRYKVGRWIVPDAINTEYTELHPKLPFAIRNKKYKIKYQMENTLGGQLGGLAFTVTDLFRDERIECNYNRGTEVRGYAERLIVEAMRHGDRHRPTMELADFWLKEKQLIHKLFKVLVPRYLEDMGPFTVIHNLGVPYEWTTQHETGPAGRNRRWWKNGRVVLELKGNPLPPILRPRINKSSLLTNMLLDGARQANHTYNTVKDLTEDNDPKVEESR